MAIQIASQGFICFALIAVGMVYTEEAAVWITCFF